MHDAEIFWNERFDTAEFIFGKEPNHYLIGASKKFLTNKSQVLCVADGEGRNSVWLAKQSHQVDAFDVSSIALGKARKFAEEQHVNVQYIHADCDSFCWSVAHYDAVVAIFIQFADPELRQRLFKQMINCLKPGGILILQGYTGKQIEYKTGGPTDPANLYSAPLMHELLDGMEILDIQCYEQILDEGPRHRGISALIGVVAKK